MLYKKVALLSSIVLSSLSLNANAAILVDGNLSDWLNAPTIGSESNNDWTNFNQSNVSYTVEDQIGDFLDPGYGGQTYDAEAMYLNFDSGSNTLNIAIVTGLPSSGTVSYKLGDISFDLDGNQTYEYAMVVTPHEVSNTGESNAQAGYFVQAANVSGSSDTGAWNYTDIPTYDDNKEHPTQVVNASGSVLSKNNLVYSKLEDDFANIGGLGLGEPHYLIETSVQFTEDGDYGSAFLAAISAGTLNVHWNPTCNNDYIIANIGSQGNGVPEPGSLALVALGLIGFGVKKRKA